MTVIKICGLTTLEDARWAARCGADLLGFIFVPSSPRYVTPDKVAEITGALAAEGCTARFVGVFADEPAEAVRQIATACALHLVQLHGQESPPYVRSLGLPAIVARRVRGAIPWEELASFRPWAYLLDSYDPRRPGGTGQPWPWELLAEGGRRLGRVILAGGLRPENVGEALRRARPWGVDVSSGVEASPGCKDPDKVARFIRQVREASESLPPAGSDAIRRSCPDGHATNGL